MLKGVSEPTTEDRTAKLEMPSRSKRLAIQETLRSAM